MAAPGEETPLAAFEIGLLVCHLACADTPENACNQAQLIKFQDACRQLPGARRSLANSGVFFLGHDFHFDTVRPGIALYGGRAFESGPNPMEPVVRLYARILQVQSAEAGESVGYGATCILKKRTRIATVALGYADGFMRLIGGDATKPGATGFIGDYSVPVIGRVSMDLITLDVSAVPEHLAQRGGWIEMLSERITVDDLAQRASTIGYEVLTRLSHRAHRAYLEA